MKVERKEKAFEPVVITLETWEEVNALITAVRYTMYEGVLNCPASAILATLDSKLVKV